jgi:hypothetical protein
MVADEDVDALDAEVWMRLSGGSRSGGHGEIIRVRRMTEEAQLLISRLGRRSVYGLMIF